MQCIVDCTTHNQIYNPISAQGLWYRHVWGKREYPEIDLDPHTIPEFSPDTSITLQCEYGDPLCWSHLPEFLQCRPGVSVKTYGSDSAALKAIKQHSPHVIVDIDGLYDMCGKVFLGHSWERLKSTLETLTAGDTLCFSAFEHNQHQLQQVIRIAQDQELYLEIKPGTIHNNPGISMIDQQLNWLYDVVPAQITVPRTAPGDLSTVSFSNLQQRPLEKTLWGYSSLRTYLPVLSKRNLHEHPLVTNAALPHDLGLIFEKDSNQQNGVYITPDSVRFDNSLMYSFYMRMLGRDWDASINVIRKLSEMTPENAIADYSAQVVFYAKKIKELLNSDIG